MPSTALILPPELWLYIAQFVPDECLRNLFQVNSVFFHTAMDIRYGNVTLTALDTHTTRLVERLQDPFVAKRIVSLEVKPHLKDISQRTKEPPRTSFERLRTSWSPRTESYSVHLSPEDTSKALTQAFPKMVNLKELTIDAFDMPPECDSTSFFSATWEAFSGQLERISIRGHTAAVEGFVASNPVCPRVMVLDIELAYNIFTRDRPIDLSRPLRKLSTFMNSLSSSLKTINIMCWQAIDLSMLFQNLSQFPYLCQFRLRAPFNEVFWSDPSGLAMFLKAHASGLQTLVLRLNPTRSSLDANPERTLGLWLSDTLAECSFASLQDLQIYPTTSEAGFEALLSCVRRLPASLSSFCARDRYLTLEEAKQLQAAFDHSSNSKCLKSLRIYARSLSIDVFDVLFKGFPALDSLSLFVGSLEPLAFKEFTRAILQRPTIPWRLYNIGIWYSGAELDVDVMRQIARYIPSIRSFWGNGNMEGDEEARNANYRAGSNLDYVRVRA